MKHLVDLKDFSLDEVKKILDEAFIIKKNPSLFSENMKGKILATIFFEPSTRTQFSFQTAIYKLGGQNIGFSNSSNSSVSKGENFKDTIKIVSSYADILVIRHPLAGAALAASFFSSCPIINAGDGGHLHPTQTLTDIFTILEEKKTLSGLSIGLCGDLKFSRTINSLVEFLIRFKDNEFFLISSENFKISSKIKKEIINSKNKLIETVFLQDVINKLDVLYMTRMQKERFLKEDLTSFEYVNLSKKMLEFAKKDLIIMHPLPKNKEIDFDVDEDCRAVYFKQALNGVFVRMALINFIVNLSGGFKAVGESCDIICSNKSCITNHEEYLPKLYIKNGEKMYCEYCGELNVKD